MKIDEKALDQAWLIFEMRRDELKTCPTCEGSGFGLNRCHCWMCKKTGSIKANTVEDSFTAAIEAYEAAKGAQDPRNNYAPWQCSMCGARAEGPDSEPYCSCGSKRFARTWIS